MKFYIKIIIMLLSNVVLGVSIGLFRLVNLGTDPFSSMVIGLNNVTHLSFGTIQCIANASLLLAMFVWKKENIGLGTFPSIFLNGYVSDFVYFSLQNTVLDFDNIIEKLILLAFALIICTFSVALYIEINLGTSGYDTLAIIIEKQTHRKISFKMGRILTDLICLSIGVSFGAVIGINTIIMSVFTGILVNYFRKKIHNRIPFNFNNLFVKNKNILNLGEL